MPKAITSFNLHSYSYPPLLLLLCLGKVVIVWQGSSLLAWLHLKLCLVNLKSWTCFSLVSYTSHKNLKLLIKCQGKHRHRNLKMLYSEYSLFKYLDFFKTSNFCRKLRRIGWAEMHALKLIFDKLGMLSECILTFM